MRESPQIVKPDIERKQNIPSITPIRKKILSGSVEGLLRKLISEKAFSETGKLPPEEGPARQPTVSHITIRKVLTGLEQEGLLLRIHGRGTFMNPAVRQVKVNLSDMLEFGSVIDGNEYRSECRLISVDKERILASVGEHLGAGKGSRGIWVEELYPVDDIPAIVSMGRISLHLPSKAPARTDWQEKSNFEVVQEHAGCMVVWDWIEVSSLSAQEAGEILGHPCPLKAASVLMVQAMGYDQNNEPIIHEVALYDTSRTYFNLLRHAEG